MSVIEWRIGLRPLAADLMPLLGEVPGVPGLFVATGLGGTGLALGPPTGRLLAKSMMGRSLTLELAPYVALRKVG